MTTSADTGSSRPSTAAIPILSPEEQKVRWRAYAIAVAVASLTILDLAKINVAIPAISDDLGASATQVQLLVAGFVLAFGLLLVPSGRIGDLYSRRTMFLIGLTLFTLSSLAGALSPTIELLVASRIAQGFAAGLLMPQVLGLIQQLFLGQERGRAFGIFGAVIGLSTAFGPTLGGILVGVGGSSFGWHLLFWMNVPLGIAAFIGAVRLLPKKQDIPDYVVKDFDVIGTVLLGVTVFSFMLPFVLTTGTETDEPARWWWLVLAVVSALAFGAWEKGYLARGRVAIIDFTLFQVSSFRNGVAISSFYFAALPATFIAQTLWLQNGLGFSPVVAGMVTIPFALLSALSSWRSGLVVHRYGRILVVGGLILVITGFSSTLILGYVVSNEWMAWAVAGSMAVAGLGGGAVISPNQTLMLEDIPVREGGLAGSIAQLGQRIGTAIGLAGVLSALFYGVSQAGVALNSDAYLQGFTLAALASVGLVVASLVFALLDMRARKHPVVRR
ncbi:MFS efflux permease [Pontimonas salivibrio]|uniref:MFS efflux permease n=1 Tax=Pontimonas salivibrio TaxID=1159327 RepID=A0A2L2BRZ4_9MICO|nr:MFS transporter [Pontimonas salivibrio]AVG24421.1 MFS efflux permease [Pontimonas salivibrio]